jgi:hypothetical protein
LDKPEVNNMLFVENDPVEARKVAMEKGTRMVLRTVKSR